MHVGDIMISRVNAPVRRISRMWEISRSVNASVRSVTNFTGDLIIPVILLLFKGSRLRSVFDTLVKSSLLACVNVACP